MPRYSVVGQGWLVTPPVSSHLTSFSESPSFPLAPWTHQTIPPLPGHTKLSTLAHLSSAIITARLPICQTSHRRIAFLLIPEVRLSEIQVLSVLPQYPTYRLRPYNPQSDHPTPEVDVFINFLCHFQRKSHYSIAWVFSTLFR